MFPSLDNLEYSGYTYVSTGFGVDVSFQLICDCWIIWYVNYARSYKLSSRVAVLFCIPTNANESFYCSTSSSASGVVSVLDSNHFNKFKLVSHCFNFQVPNNKVFGIFSYAYCHLHVIDEGSVQIYCPFLSGVGHFLTV